MIWNLYFSAHRFGEFSTPPGAGHSRRKEAELEAVVPTPKSATDLITRPCRAMGSEANSYFRREGPAPGVSD